MTSELKCDISEDFREWYDYITGHDDCGPWEHAPFKCKTGSDAKFQPSIAIVIDPHSEPGFGLAEYLHPIATYCSKISLDFVVYNSGLRSDLIKALEYGHLIVIVYHHGDEHSVICYDQDINYSDGFTNIALNLGCLISNTCGGNEVEFVVCDEDGCFGEFSLLEWLCNENVPCGFIGIEKGHYLRTPEQQEEEAKLVAYMISLLLNRDFEGAWKEYQLNAPNGNHEHFRPFGNMKLKLSELMR